MKQLFIILFLIVMTNIQATTQWSKSTFFNDYRKNKYKIDLHFEKDISLSSTDVEQFISILSTHKWEQNKDESAVGWEINEISWGRYHFYTKAYSFTVTHPDKRKVEIRIDAKGIKSDVFQICSSTGKFQYALRIDEDYKNRLSQDEVKTIMQLFWNNVPDFGNIIYTPEQEVKISSYHSFTNVFQGLKLPDIQLTPQESQQLAKLYNKGWSTSAHSFPGGIPIPTTDLFNTSVCIYFGDMPYSYNNPLFEFSEKDQLAIKELIENAMKGHDGMQEIELQRIHTSETQTVRYHYKDGVLQGDVEVFNGAGKLTERISYDKNIPIRYSQYGSHEQLRLEVLFFPEKHQLEWFEYEENGQVLDSGENHYIQTYPMWDIDLFYKYSR